MGTLQIIVIGGGAAGFFGAIAAAKSHPHPQVTILEASPQVLGKVRISGGGRCNVTHACFEPKLLVQNYPRGNKALLGAFSRFQAQDTVTWFQKHGVHLKTEADGRMFPITDTSETITSCLVNAANAAKIKIQTRTPVNRVTYHRGKYEITLKSGEKQECDRLLMATGSNPIGYQIAQSLGHTIISPVPSLFTFNVRDTQLNQLAGISLPNVKIKLSVPDHPGLEQTGAFLITHWGFSGPVILKLSAWGARILHQHRYQAKLQINFLPHLSPEEIRQQLIQTKEEVPRKTMFLYRGVEIPHRLWQYLLSRANIQEQVRWAEVSKRQINQLITELTQGQYLVSGKGVFKDEFVTCGGVDLKEINFKTMESKISPGLYFAGEILDIDGITGGFNFQSAWTTGYLAGCAMAI
ncbi:NAD(P)/FAD-dependent oxidoreductase [Calothrix sp. NIES-3974]|uniref:NAD(P)/FAD-dependent oxidoreductase n=1 Tax=Calothrix sp. NIES-3974 TaxID=2005462 RepID=UPI000B5ED6A8|nr:NAD(P)/FAD-dependent oxidoreductase [Calothrix sp. NIES-3974]BAZ03578.1 hypothetical protein NIES3974_02070 [Calothrix sp. NIES-3974]